MKPAPFSYLRPSTLTEALEAHAQHPDAKILAGGQSLIPLLSMRLASPPMLIDLNGLAELDYVRCDDAGVRIGAMARHARVESDARARTVQPLLSQALRLVAHPTIRNRGTTVGSIVHADPAGEMPMLLCLLGGRLTAGSATGSRDISAADLFLGPLETTLGPAEIATEVFVPALAPFDGVAVQEISRRDGDYALCGVAAVVSTRADGALDAVRAGYLSVTLTPLVLDLTPAFSGAVDPAGLEAAADLAMAAVEPEADIHATADYRRHLAGVLTKRVVGAAAAHAHDRLAGAAA